MKEDKDPTLIIKNEARENHDGTNAFSAKKALRVRKKWALISCLLLSTAAFFVLAFFESTTGSLSIDMQITRALQSLNYPAIAKAMIISSWIGYSPQSYIIVAFSTILLFCSGLRWEAVISAISSFLTQELDLLVKTAVHHLRPSADLVHVFLQLKGYSFPSGHVMFYTVYFGFNFFLILTFLRRSWKRTLLLILLCVPVLLIGVSRIYLGEHWASDVTGGYLLGGIMLTVFIQVYKIGKKRYFTNNLKPDAAHKNKIDT